MSNRPHIALIGCGKMGRALLRGWLGSNITGHILVLDPQGLPEEFAARPEITALQKAEDMAAQNITPDIIVLAVKPQIMEAVCLSIKEHIAPDTLIISIAAGQTLARFKNYFGEEHPVVRAMPNTPAAIGKGMSVATVSATVNAVQKEQAHALLAVTGEVEWIEDETLLDPVTALSGSGPAYVFLLIETLAEAGEKAGLAPEMAMRLARQTVIGSAALAAHESAVPVNILRENVTSPGGTTAAALEVLRDGRLQNIFDEALAAAAARSRALAQ